MIIKKYIVAAALIGIGGGAYAAEFSDLNIKAAVLRAYRAEDIVSVPAPLPVQAALEIPDYEGAVAKAMDFFRHPQTYSLESGINICEPLLDISMDGRFSVSQRKHALELGSGVYKALKALYQPPL